MQLLQLNSRKINDPIKKWAKELNRHFSKEDAQMANRSHYQRNANQNYNEVPSHASQNSCYSKIYSNKCQRGCGEQESLLHWCIVTLLLWWECKLIQPLWITVWRFFKILEIELPYDPAIPLLGINTKKTRIERDMCIPMFIAAQFIISRT